MSFIKREEEECSKKLDDLIENYQSRQEAISEVIESKLLHALSNDPHIFQTGKIPLNLNLNMVSKDPIVKGIAELKLKNSLT